jgi:ribonucleoside-diphosphate reductase alpha chain
MTQTAILPQPISEDVLREKYLKAGETDVEDVYRRVAQALASVEAPGDQAHYEALFWTTCAQVPLVPVAS